MIVVRLRPARFARFVLLPAFLIGDVALPWLPIDDGYRAMLLFASAYATLLSMLVAFRSRSISSLAVIASVAVILAWAVGSIGAVIEGEATGLSPLLAALAGVAFAALPAWLRERLIRAGGGGRHAARPAEAERDRGAPPAIVLRPHGDQQRRYLLLLASLIKRDEGGRTMAELLDLEAYPSAAPRKDQYLLP